MCSWVRVYEQWIDLSRHAPPPPARARERQSPSPQRVRPYYLQRQRERGGRGESARGARYTRARAAAAPRESAIRKRAVGLQAIHYNYTNTRSSSETQVLDGRLLALSRGCGAPVGRVRRKAPDHVGTSLEGSRSSSSESTTAPNCVMPPRSHDLKSAQLTCRRASSDMCSSSSSTCSGRA